jgi:hypothetical protein
MSETCRKCGSPVDFNRATCGNCELFIGFPNVRQAQSMQEALDQNYKEALTEAHRRGCTAKVNHLESLLKGSVATINVHPKLLYCMAAGAKYVSYYHAIERGFREVAERKYHAHRGAVDAKIYTGYEAEIVNAALSPDGAG